MSNIDLEMRLEFKFSFVKEHECAGWRSGYKSEEEWMNRFNIKKIKPEDSSCYSRGEQTIIIPGIDTELPLIKTNFPHYSITVMKDNHTIEPRYHPVLVEEQAPGNAAGPPNRIYFFNAPNRDGQLVAIMHIHQYEWELGTVNTCYDPQAYAADSFYNRLLSVYDFESNGRKKDNVVLKVPGYFNRIYEDYNVNINEKEKKHNV